MATGKSGNMDSIIPSSPQTVGDYLRLHRRRMRLTLSRVAEMSGVPRSSLAAWEVGRLPYVDDSGRGDDDVMRVLEVLGRVEDYPDVLRLMNAPRAERALEGSAGPSACRLSCLSLGDLLVAAQDRVSFTTEIIARAAGVSQYTWGQYKSGRMVPDRRISALGEVLALRPEEVTAIARRRASSGRDIEDLIRSAEQLENAVEEFVTEIDAGAVLPGDLIFRAVERRMIELPALRCTTTIEVLTRHAEWLARYGREPEIGPLVKRAAHELDRELTRSNRLTPNWPRVVYLKARLAARRGSPEYAYRIMSGWTGDASTYAAKEAIYRDAANYARMWGQFDLAKSLIAQAIRAAEHTDPAGVRLAKYVEAHILLDSGDPGAALEAMPDGEDWCPAQRVQECLLRAKALLVQHDSVGWTYLRTLHDLIERYGFGHLLGAAKELENAHLVPHRRSPKRAA